MLRVRFDGTAAAWSEEVARPEEGGAGDCLATALAVHPTESDVAVACGAALGSYDFADS